MIFPDRCPLHDRGDSVAGIHGPEQVHLRDKLQERRIERAGRGVLRPTATALLPGYQTDPIPGRPA